MQNTEQRRVWQVAKLSVDGDKGRPRIWHRSGSQFEELGLAGLLLVMLSLVLDLVAGRKSAIDRL